METSKTQPKSSGDEFKIAWSTQTKLPIEVAGVEHVLDAWAYQAQEPEAQALVLVGKGAEPAKTAGWVPTVRIHSGCVTGDVFHSLRCDCYNQLQAALAVLTENPDAVLIYLPYQEGRGIGLANKIRTYAEQDKGLDTVDANVELGHPIDARDYRFAAEILADLGVKELRLLTNNPGKIDALEKTGLKIIERIPVTSAPSEHNAAYLDTKRTRMDHKL